MSAWAADPSSAPPAPSPDRRLKELESEMKKGQAEHEQIKQKAAAIAKEVAGVKTDMVNAARAVQEHEEALSEMELQLGDLNRQQREKLRALDLKRQQLNGVLTALQRLAFRPSEALIAQPTSPADTVRSAILLRDVTPRIRAAANELKAEIASLTALRADVAQQKRKISNATIQLDNEHRRLAALYDRKSELQEQTEAQRRDTEKRLTVMAAEAEDLRDLLTRLEEEKRRREKEAAERAAAEKAAREAEIIARKAAAKAARDAQIAAEKAAREAERAAEQAAKEKKDAEMAAARQAREAEQAAARQARDAEEQAKQSARAAAEEDSRRRAEKQEAAQHQFSRAQGEMPFPARGEVAVKFGQNDNLGNPSKGISIETRAGAQVIAPYDGQVVFAGPFRGYGLLLIIEHGEGYHTLLAGMSRIDGTVGQHLVSGEPVGVMGSSDNKPLLYFELRRNGQPVNPLPWLTARKTKVSG